MNVTLLCLLRVKHLPIKLLCGSQTETGICGIVVVKFAWLGLSRSSQSDDDDRAGRCVVLLVRFPAEKSTFDTSISEVSSALCAAALALV